MVADATPDYRARLGLEGRGAVVLGASPSLGRQAAHALRQAGARVTCVDTDQDRASALAAEVDGIGIAADATRADDLARVFDTAIARTGRLDCIVDIIGGSQSVTIDTFDAAAVAAAFALNLTHALLVTGEAARRMRPGGAICFVGSIAGLGAMPRQSLYGAAKAALHHFVGSAAAELGAAGIRVNAVAPGFVRTPRMTARFSEADWTELAAAAPLGRVGTPDEIAGPMLFLLSDLAAFVTGQTLVVDGGLMTPIRARRVPPVPPANAAAGP